MAELTVNIPIETLNPIETLTVKIKKLYADAQMPSQGSAAAAGWDLYAYIPKGFVNIKPHTTEKISTGISLEIPIGWEGEIRPRSGLATKLGLRPANTPGTIDADYRGPILVALHNDNDDWARVDHGDRIAQILFNRVPRVKWEEVIDLEETERGAGGFGSTGTN